LTSLDRAAQLDPKEPCVYGNRALAYANLGRLEDAVAEAERALKLNAERPYYAHAARGLARLRLGRKEEAISDFERFEALASPKDPLRESVAGWKREARGE